MSLKRIAVILGVSIIASTVSACGEPPLIKPTITYMPPGWYKDLDQPLTGFYGMRTGHIGYEDAAGHCSVTINYGDIPYWYEHECSTCFKGDILGYMTSILSQGNSQGRTVAESGMMTVCGREAAYNKQTWSEDDLTIIFIGFIKDNTFFLIAIDYYNSDSKVYNEAMSLINGMEF